MKRLPISDEARARFCQKQYIRRLALFGSQLADVVRPDSAPISWWSSSPGGARVAGSPGIGGG